MTETNPLTAQQLNEMQADLDRQKATLALAKITEATVAFETHEVEELIATIAEVTANMPDSYARSQLQSTVSILASCKMVLNSERERNERIIDSNAMTLPPMPGMMPPIAPPAE